jgi:hypothetical protein
VHETGGATVAKLREVDVGDFVGNNVPIRGGLAEHDKVIVQGATLVADGESVQVIP